MVMSVARLGRVDKTPNQVRGPRGPGRTKGCVSRGVPLEQPGISSSPAPDAGLR